MAGLLYYDFLEKWVDLWVGSLLVAREVVGRNEKGGK
jgi:hypothetical protein